MVWFAVALFAIVGVVLFIWRRPIAKGQSFFWGANTPLGCVIFQAAFFLFLAAAFIVAYNYGIIGSRR